jgi:hypothetical protein
MKIYTALIAACLGTLVLLQADLAQAVQDPIPGLNIIVHGLAVPRKPAQGQNSGNSPDAGVVVPAKPKPAGSSINPSRSGIKQPAK